MSDLVTYTQAVTDLNAENEKLKEDAQNFADLFRASQEVVNQYKEALRELIEQINKCPLDLSSDEKVEEAIFLDSIISEAKQLITK